MRTADPTDPFDPTHPPGWLSAAREPAARPDGSRSLGQDLQALQWLEGSGQLSELTRSLVEEVVTGWVMAGLELPGQLHPDRVPAGGHPTELAAIVGRWAGHAEVAAGVATIMQVGRAGLVLSLAVRAAADPEGVRVVLAGRGRREPPELPDWALSETPADVVWPGLS